jgi:hypothetical protein
LEHIPSAELRHARACPGHPRLSLPPTLEDVDGRDKPGHDEQGSCSTRLEKIQKCFASWFETALKKRLLTVRASLAI